MWQVRGQSKGRENRVPLLLFAVSVATRNMPHQQVDFSSVPRGRADLLCNKCCLWELDANARHIPHTARRTGPILPPHNWQSMKDSIGVEVSDHLLAPAITGPPPLSLWLLWSDGTKGRTGRGPRSCAHRTPRPDEAKWQRGQEFRTLEFRGEKNPLET